MEYDVKKIRKECEEDLKEIAHFYGGWDELRKIVDQLEEADGEAAYERRFEGDGIYAANH